MFGDWIQSGSHLAILAVLVLSGTGLPIPEEVTVVAAAVASRQDLLPVWSALICCVIGAIAGDCVMYGIGRYFGRSVLRKKWLSRFLTPSREEKIEQMIQRHGVRLFFLARFMVGIRSPMYLTCGIMRVPFLKFLLADLLSAIIVVGSFFGLGYFFGQELVRWIREAEIGVTIAVISVIVALIGYHYYHLRKQAREIDSDGEDATKVEVKPNVGAIELAASVASTANELVEDADKVAATSKLEGEPVSNGKAHSVNKTETRQKKAKSDKPKSAPFGATPDPAASGVHA